MQDQVHFRKPGPTKRLKILAAARGSLVVIKTYFKLTCSLYFEPIAHEKAAVQVAVFLQLDFLDFSLLLQQKSVSHSFSILMKVEFEVDGQFE